MSQNGNQKPIPRSENMSEETIRQFLINQEKQINLDAEKQQLKLEELRLNARLAEKSLELQASVLQRQPIEGRKNITRLGYIIGGFVIVFLFFVAYCLYLGKDDFLISFLQKAGYLVTTLMGYWAGRRVGKESEKPSQDPIDEVEIIDTGR